MKRTVETSAGSALTMKKPKVSVLHKVVRLLEDVTESELAQLKALVLVRSNSAKFHAVPRDLGESELRSYPTRGKSWECSGQSHHSSSVQEVIPVANERGHLSTPTKVEQQSSCEVVSNGEGWTGTQSFDYFQRSQMEQEGSITRGNCSNSRAFFNGDSAPQRAGGKNCVQDSAGDLPHFAVTCATPPEQRAESTCTATKPAKKAVKANSVEDVSVPSSHITPQPKTLTRNVSKKNKSFKDHPDYIALRAVQDELLYAKKREKVNTLWKLGDTSFVGRYLFAQMKWHLRKECSRARCTIVRQNTYSTAAVPDAKSQSTGKLRRKALSECEKLAKRCGGLSALELRSDHCSKFFKFCCSSFLFTVEETEGMRVCAASSHSIPSSVAGKINDISRRESPSELSDPIVQKDRHIAQENRDAKHRELENKLTKRENNQWNIPGTSQAHKTLLKLVNVPLKLAKSVVPQQEKYATMQPKKHLPGQEQALVKPSLVENHITQVLAKGENPQMQCLGAPELEEPDEYFDCHSSPANPSMERSDEHGNTQDPLFAIPGKEIDDQKSERAQNQDHDIEQVSTHKAHGGTPLMTRIFSVFQTLNTRW